MTKISDFGLEKPRPVHYTALTMEPVEPRLQAPRLGGAPRFLYPPLKKRKIRKEKRKDKKIGKKENEKRKKKKKEREWKRQKRRREQSGFKLSQFKINHNIVCHIF